MGSDLKETLDRYHIMILDVIEGKVVVAMEPKELTFLYFSLLAAEDEILEGRLRQNKHKKKQESKDG